MEIQKQTLKDINTFMKSISPTSIEKISLNLGLNGTCKQVLLLRYRDNYSIESVAEQLNVSVATVNRIIRKIKVMIALEISSNQVDKDNLQ
jgi:rRNA maturation endonuclease Nob1